MRTPGKSWKEIELSSEDFLLFSEFSKNTVYVFSAPPTTLTAEARYDLVASALGGRGYLCRNTAEITNAVDKELKSMEGFSVINVLISPTAERKPQEFFWLTRSKM